MKKENSETTTTTISQDVVYDGSPLGDYFEDISSPVELIKTTQYNNKISSIWNRLWELPNQLFSSIQNNLESVWSIQFRNEPYYRSLKSSLQLFINSQVLRSSYSLQHCNGKSIWSFSSALLVESLSGIVLCLIKLLLPNQKILVNTLSYCLTVLVPWQIYQDCIRWQHLQLSKAIIQFLNTSHKLDILLKTSIRTIQEVELVTRGYRLSTPLSPISRMEQSNSSKRCLEFRNFCNMIIEEQTNLILLQLGKIEHKDMIPNFTFIDHKNPIDIHLSYLKDAFTNLRYHRVALLSILLQNMDSPFFLKKKAGSNPPVQWLSFFVKINESANKEVLKLEDILKQQLSFDRINTDYDQTCISLETPIFHRSISNLLNHLQTINAQLIILKEELLSAEQPEKISTIKADLTTTLRLALNDWESSCREKENAEMDQNSFEMNFSFLEQNAELHEPNREADIVDAKNIEIDSEESQEQVFEFDGEAESISVPVIEKEKKKLSRAERILLQKAKQEQEKKTKNEGLEKIVMISELKAVLDKRK